MKRHVLILLLFCSGTLSAQYAKRHIQLSVGYGTHGTGDLDGIQFTTEYGQYFKRQISWIVGVSGTIHDGSYPIFYKNQLNNLMEDGSVRFTTAGAQVSGHIGVDVLKAGYHAIQLRAGGLLRYQSSSVYDIVGIIEPIATNYPYPLVELINRGPQQTFAAGGSAQFHYSYTFRSNISIGLLAGLQIDTEDDLISQIGLSVGKRF